MIIKVFFSKPNVKIPVNNQKQLNSFIHRCIGENNEFHDKFSDYAISSLQGGKLNSDKKTLSFNDNPYIVISSENIDFLQTIMMGIQFKNEKLYDMSVNNIMPCGEYSVNQFFDKVITISPILLKDKENKKITIKDDKWINLLIENCKNKLKHLNIIDNTFNIEIRNHDKAKEKSIYVGEVFNPSSLVSLKIYGKKKTRIALYNLGLGNSTGSGFGSIKIFEK